MANSTDILNRLREHEVPPPAAAFGQLMKRLEREPAAREDLIGAWQGLQEFDVPPPALLSAAIVKAISEKPLFAALQEHTVQPPAALLHHILRDTIGVEQQAVNGNTTVRSFFYRFRAVAAVLLLMMAGYTLYEIAGNREASPPPTAILDHNAAHKPAARPAPAHKTAGGNALARYRVYDNPKTENYFDNNVFAAEGSDLPLIDNDFMVTLASYEWEDLPAFLYEEEESELLVRLDQYSYFTISESMMNNLRKMYQRKAKGTPTRKAKREMLRLEKWKKADERRFDREQTRNPLDPIDLAEFVFDY